MPGFVATWFLAASPTSFSPSFVNATQEGVTRLPWSFGTISTCRAHRMRAHVELGGNYSRALLLVPVDTDTAIGGTEVNADNVVNRYRPLRLR